jgi:hypothetical protein
VKVFKAYREVPWYAKEAVGLPDNYDDLSNDQQHFVDEFYMKVAGELSVAEVKEDLVVIKSDLEDLIDRI